MGLAPLTHIAFNLIPFTIVLYSRRLINRCDQLGLSTGFTIVVIFALREVDKDEANKVEEKKKAARAAEKAARAKIAKIAKKQRKDRKTIEMTETTETTS